MRNRAELLLSGNEAIARGAYEAGVAVAAGYPGTPSSEILESLAQYDGKVYCEWAPNEKVAVEVAAGASLVGVRSMATMKHVGLNVAADPLMTLSYWGTGGGLVAVVADDPGMYSSQNEQDSRNYARFAKIPMFEPSDSQEAKDFIIAAFELSEKFNTPVILRSSTRISHGKSVVKPGKRKVSPKKIEFLKNPPKYVAVPSYARKMRERMEKRLAQLRLYVNKCSQNQIISKGKEVGVVASGVAFQYAREEFKEASLLKLGFSYPFPDDLIREFAHNYQELIVIEELDNFLEEHIRSLGIKTKGREYFPGLGELNPDRVAQGHYRLKNSRVVIREKKSVDENNISLPARPPMFCPGCPSRGLFYALSKIDCVVSGDIGCYSLGVFPPYERLDTILCMGAGITIAQGMDKAGLKDKPVIGIIGDSTFFHSGIAGLLELSYNKGISTIIIVDNRATAMTGLQEHPGTGKTLMRKRTYTAHPEDFARACGIKNIHIIDPLDFEQTLKVLKKEVKKEAASVIISRRACVLVEKLKKKPLTIDSDKCTQCGRCLKIGCPAIYREKTNKKTIVINEILCTGCGFCTQVCPKEAITAKE